MDLDALDHERYMERALDLAREAGERGDGPYGSVLVHDGEVVVAESNRVHTEDDIARHPELTIARRAASELPAADRAEAVMYTSTEPCSMCATGMAIAGLGAVVYSVSGERAADLAGGPPGVPCGEVFERWGRDVRVVGDVRHEEGVAIHREYR